MTKKKVPKSVIFVAIGALVLLEIIAIFKEIDGQLFAGIVAAIAGLAGWNLPQLKLK